MCVDDYSRVAYAEVLPDERKESAAALLQRAVEWFGQFGITIRRVLTDNGSCYRSQLWHTTGLTGSHYVYTLPEFRRYRQLTQRKLLL